MLSLALMTIFMKKYFSSDGIKSTGWNPLTVESYPLLQQAMWVTYGIYRSMLQYYLLFLISLLYSLFCIQVFFLIYVLFCMSMFTK